MKRKLWLLVTSDEYELPLAVADSAGQLARLLKVKPQTIRKQVCNARRRGINSHYKVIEIEEGENGNED